MAAVKRDYYEVLGVPRDADKEAIRRAFHGLARECHPDVADSPDAEQQFRELAEAYGVLSRREARLLYDRYGYRGRGNQGFDEALWDVRPPAQRGESIHLDLELQSFEAAEQGRRVVRYDVSERCKACMGHGTRGLPDPECEVCGGSGRKRSVASLDAANLVQFEACPACVAEACVRCDGTGMVSVERRLRLILPPGLEDGTQLRVSGEGNEGRTGSIPGDLLVEVRVVPPPRDSRLIRYAALVLLIAAVTTLILYVFVR
jgi:molecular chaperone DnaJ